MPLRVSTLALPKVLARGGLVSGWSSGANRQKAEEQIAGGGERLYDC